MIVHINIGSNLGNRTENLQRAVSLLDTLVGQVVSISHVIESEAWGYESSNPFLNLGVNVETPLKAAEIIQRLEEIEQEIDPSGCHRNSKGGYADRIIDLDLICMSNLTVDTPKVTLPHPRMHLREFVLRPMTEIMPDWEHPLLQCNPLKLLEKLTQ